MDTLEYIKSKYSCSNAITFPFVMQDITEWSKRVRPGGIISSHDYCSKKQGEAKDAVDAYIQENKIACWFLCDVSTYFWVKEA